LLEDAVTYRTAKYRKLPVALDPNDTEVTLIGAAGIVADGPATTTICVALTQVMAVTGTPASRTARRSLAPRLLPTSVTVAPPGPAGGTAAVTDGTAECGEQRRFRSDSTYASYT
jgi:hypothetical protein